MSHTGGCYLVISAGANTYFRYIKKYSDEQETAFKQDARLAEANGQPNIAILIRLGSIQRKTYEPKNAIEI